MSNPSSQSSLINFGRFSRTLLATLFLVACQINPVTGERQLQFYGSDWENQVGTQMYAPLKQSQGGEWNMDSSLNRYVSDVGQRLAKQARRDNELNYEFSVLNNSTPNAWALPGGKIVINRGLLAQLDTEAELAAVLSHEIVHADAAHGARQQSTGMLAQVGALASMVVLDSQIESPAGRQLAMLVPNVGLQLIMQRYSRDAEREADEYGMQYMSEAGYDPRGAVRLQETFVQLSEERRQGWLDGLFASHPPSEERVQNNERKAAALPAGGEIAEQRYQQNIAYLQRVQPAYDLYDEAGKALSENRVTEAQRKLSRALDMVPREALFLAMQGDIYRQDDRLRNAVGSYEESIRANPGLFYGYLRKGQVEYELGRTREAENALERSLGLLPTAEAHFLLGKIDQSRGDERAAAEHFAQASESQSRAGQAAQEELVRLDLATNTSRYVATQLVQDDNGYVWVQFGNRSRVPIENIQLTYIWVDANGRTLQDSVVYRGPLAAGNQDRVRLDVRLPANTSLSSRIRVQATGGAVVNT